MRRSPGATSRTGGPGAASVSLFPFLAVLICTMGALIVLLVAITQQVRLHASQAAEADAEESARQGQDIEAERELVQWRISQIKVSRDAIEQQLADARLKLGQIEDHARQLEDKLARLRTIWAELESLARDGSGRREGLEEELAEFERRIAEAERQLADAQEAAAGRRLSYAVVPYEGPHATHRQPIYIECRADAIVLQPEGIELHGADFMGPLGPGNPLDAALRARREYLLNHGRLNPEESGEAYPLLLVRPSGIEAYYAARAAMQSWASDFGYELVGEDWSLKFPPTDLLLAQEMARAVDTARVRQVRLALAVPVVTGAGQRPKYRAAPYLGGAVLDSGGGGGSGLASNSAGRKFGGGYGKSSKTAVPTEGAVVGRPPREQDDLDGPNGAVRRPGEWTPGPDSPDRGTRAGARSTAAGRPLADSRGPDWGLPDTARGSVPITRPIRVDCYRDRLVIVPERGASGAKEVPLRASTEDGIDELLSGVWSVMDRWGIAGQGMVWRPVLNVRVAPDAEWRFAELETLLDGSGLGVTRKHGP